MFFRILDSLYPNIAGKMLWAQHHACVATPFPPTFQRKKEKRGGWAGGTAAAGD